MQIFRLGCFKFKIQDVEVTQVNCDPFKVMKGLEYREIFSILHVYVGLDPDCWETDSAGSRRESIASTASGCGSGELVPLI